MFGKIYQLSEFLNEVNFLSKKSLCILLKNIHLVPGGSGPLQFGTHFRSFQSTKDVKRKFFSRSQATEKGGLSESPIEMGR